MNKDNIKTQIVVNNQPIDIVVIDNREYISLTDLALDMQMKMNRDIQYKIG